MPRKGNRAGRSAEARQIDASAAVHTPDGRPCRGKRSASTAVLQASSFAERARAAGGVLARTRIYRSLPVFVRAQLDSAILLRAPGCRTLEQIGKRFELQAKHDISHTALKEYAGKLEQLIRPAMTSEVIAGVLGCLPEDCRERLLAGSQVMLVSRVIQALADEESAGSLSVADLARLATILRSATRQSRVSGGSSTRRGGIDCAATGNVPLNEDEIAQAMAHVYGLLCPGQSDRPRKP